MAIRISQQALPEAPVKVLAPTVKMSAPYQSGATEKRSVVSGRISSLSHYSDATVNYLYGDENSVGSDRIIINFPSMPDSIELARSATYKVMPSFVLPDGIHQYQYTEPQEIPFSFKIHAFDEEYCPQGSLTLLKIAGWLEALILPIGDSSQSISGTAVGPAFRQGSTPTGTEAAKTAGDVSFNEGEAASASKVSFPVACKLELCYVDSNSPGISCIGYVKSVRPVLLGPWLAPRGAGARSLPSALEASFVFVHRPAHTNSFARANSDLSSSDLPINTQVQAYANDVKDRLYNTADLIRSSAGVTFRGFNKSK
jgi:hypothetical protein